MILLSRVADCMYWFGRYIERAENTARMVDVNLQLLLDLERLDDHRITAHWDPLIRSTGDSELFDRLYGQADSENVTDFLTFNTENPGSILSSIVNARENARVVRDKLSTEIWEEINRLYHYVRSLDAKRVWASDPYDFYREIKQSSHLLHGLADATVVRDEAWEFLQAGRLLERAIQTNILVDIKYHILLPSTRDVGGAIDALQWMAILRSCSGFEAYHHIHGADVQPWHVADFLILSEEFPRSILFCLRELDAGIRTISGVSEGRFSNRAGKLAGRLLYELKYSTVDDIFEAGLHEYLTDLRARTGEIARALYEAFMFFPVLDDANSEAESRIQR